MQKIVRKPENPAKNAGRIKSVTLKAPKISMKQAFRGRRIRIGYLSHVMVDTGGAVSKLHQLVCSVQE